MEGITQRGVRTVRYPTLSRRFRTNHRQLRYRPIRTDIFIDTMFSAIKSKRGNKCVQVYSHSTGWVRTFPMRREREAHKRLPVLFKRDGVPNNIVMDGAKTQIQGDFKKKCKESGCHTIQVDPIHLGATHVRLLLKYLSKHQKKTLDKVNVQRYSGMTV